MKFRTKFEILMITLTFFFIGYPTPALSERPVNSMELQAAFIYQFTQYIRWPQQAENTNTPFTISIVGKSEIFSFLKKITDTHTVGDRKIVLVEISPNMPLPKSELVVFATNDDSWLKSAYEAAQKMNALSVSLAEISVPLDLPIIIRMLNVGARIRFKINRSTAEKANLILSSQLLKLAYTEQ